MGRNKYFDQWEFTKIISFIDDDPLTANRLFKEYLERYRYDYTAYCYYAGTFITFGKFEEAEKILDYVDKQVEADIQYSQFNDNYREYKKNYIFTRSRLLSYTERYLELYRFATENKRLYKEMQLNEVLFWSRYKTDNLLKSTDDLKRYFYKQMVNYNKEDALEHIQRHCADYNKDLDTNEKNKNIFSVGFPLEKVMEEVEKYLLTDKVLYSGFTENVYVFKYDECGRVNGKVVDYFKVICFHNTKNIITMCPVLEGKYLPCVDLNYLKEEKESNIKLESKREKFYKRYGRK